MYAIDYYIGNCHVKLHSCGGNWKSTRIAVFAQTRLSVGHNDVFRCSQIRKIGLFKYAHEHGCPWDINTCINSAYGGHLDCLTYAHENGCPWHTNVCTFAVKNNHLDCLQYAHEHGCPWDTDTCSSAVSYGSLDCLRYRSHNNTLIDNTIHSTGTRVRVHSRKKCLQYAHENGLTMLVCNELEFPTKVELESSGDNFNLYKFV